MAVMERRRAARTGSWLEVLFALLMSHYLAWWVFPAAIAALAYYLIGSSTALLLCAIYFSPLHLFSGRERRGGARWKWLCERDVWRYMHQYLDARWLRASPPVDPSVQYLFGVFPHGLLGVNRICFTGKPFRELYPGVEARFVGATPQFLIPGCREIAMALGAVDASRASLEHILRGGESILLWPGGSKEIFMADDSDSNTRVYLKKRFGFIKLALRFGAHLVPSFAFGEQRTLRTAKFLPQSVIDFALRMFKIPLVLFWGRFGTWLPFQRDRQGRNMSIGLVFGEPIVVEKDENPSPEAVQALHALFCERLQALFEKHKAEHDVEESHKLIIC